MAYFLYRIGAWSVARRKLVLALWVGLLVIGGVGATSLAGDTSDVFTLPGTESQKAIDQLKEEMPGADGASGTIVFVAPEGLTVHDTKIQSAINDVVAFLSATTEPVGDAIPELLIATNPYETGLISPDETIALSSVSYSVPAVELSESAKDTLREAADIGRQGGMTIEIGGDVLAEVPEQGSAEIIGLIAAIIILLFTFGSLVAAGLPILTALIGVGLGMMGITIATGFVEMNSTAPTLAVMLGLAVGIDYALFIVTRHRQLMASGLSPEESAARATGTAGSAVVFAGATVIIALVALFVINIPFLTVMGLAAAATVAIAVIIAVTLIPALLGFAGNTIDRFRVPGRRIHAGLGSDRTALGARWGQFVTRRAPIVLASCLVFIAIFAIPLSKLELGLPDNGSKSTSTSERRSYDLIANAFGPGFNGPLVVAANLRAIDDVEVGTAALDAALNRFVSEGKVISVAPAGASEDGLILIYSIVPLTGPAHHDTATLVDSLRESLGVLRAETGVDAMVTGMTALNIDITNRLGQALPLYGTIVVGLALVLLMLVFRSILVPIKAAIGFVLSVIVAFGATVAVFQWGWMKAVIGLSQPAPIISILPILLLGILFGLAMDYEVFLVSRIREDFVHNGDATQGVIEGVRHSARVIVAAGLIMVVVFSAFVLSSDPNMKMIGFALAAGIFADAFIVRMTIVPAALSLMGNRAWWLPRWLDHTLPNVDIEGEGLIRRISENPDSGMADEKSTNSKDTRSSS